MADRRLVEKQEESGLIAGVAFGLLLLCTAIALALIFFS